MKIIILKKINKYLQLSDLISDEFSDLVFELIKRICLFEKARTLLPKEIFMLIKIRVEDHHDKIRLILERSYDKLNFKDGIPKITIMANHNMWFFENIDWGITRSSFTNFRSNPMDRLSNDHQSNALMDSKRLSMEQIFYFLDLQHCLLAIFPTIQD